MQEFSIVKGGSAHATQVGALAGVVIPTAYDRAGLSPEQREENKKVAAMAQPVFESSVAADDRGVFVALDDGGNVAGFVIAIRYSAHSAEIDWIVVDPAHHGKSVAQSLLAAALAWIGPDSEIRLGVITYNRRAISFYKRNGFEETSRGGGNHLIPRMLMVRPARSNAGRDKERLSQ